MDCVYFVPWETDPITYDELVNYFKEKIKDFDTDIVYSLATKQDQIFSELLDIKLKDKSEIKENSSGEPDYSEGKAFTTQTFIDSNYFVINDTRPILQQTDKDYEDNLVRIFMDEEHLSEELARAKAKNQRSKEKNIGNDARDFHILMNSFNWTHGDIQDWIDHCRNTKFEPQTLELWKQVVQLRKVMYARHKLNNSSAKILTGLNLRAQLKNLSEEIFGHYDNIVIDANGNLHLYNYKVTSTPISEWQAVKLEKYKYQMALLKQILAHYGYNVRNMSLHIVPIQFKYDSNYENINEVLIESFNNLELTINNGKYVFSKYDDAAKHFILSKVKFNSITSEQVQRINNNLKVFFQEKDINYAGISKTVDEWIQENYNPKMQLRIKNSSKPGYSYEVYLDDDLENPEYIKESTHPYHNEELKEKVSKKISEIQEKSPIIMQRVLDTIENSRTYGFSMFGTSEKGFGYSGEHLGVILNKYFKFKEINGNKLYDWELIENDILSQAGIIMFRNNETEQVDVITLSPQNLDVIVKFKGRNNIMGSLCPDNTKAGRLIEYNGSYANIEAVRTMLILNEAIPNIDGQLKLGQLIIASPKGNGQTKFFDLVNFNKNCFQECVKVVKRNVPEFQYVNNFSKVEFVDPLQIVKQQIEQITSSSNEIFSKSEKEAFINLGIENAESQKSKSVKAQMIREIMRKIEESKDFPQISERTPINNIIEKSKYSKGRESEVCNLYIALAKALTYYEDLEVNDEKYIGKGYRYGFTQNRVPNKTYRGVVQMFTISIDEIASEVQSTYSSINLFVDDYLKAKGYTRTKNSIVGNQANYFKHLYKQNEKGEHLMEFRNPYLDSDEFGRLDSADRTFLKKALFVFAKFRCLASGKQFDIKSYDDPKLKEFIEKNKSWYFNAPLMKASDASILQRGIKSQINEWKRKATLLLKNGEEKFNEFMNGTSSEDVEESVEDLKVLRLRNPFLKGDEGASRERYLLAHDLDYFEYDISTILGQYVTQYIKCKKLNETLLTAKAIMLQLEMTGAVVNKDSGIKQTISMISDYIKRNVFNQSLMEPGEQKIVKWLSPFRELVSRAYIAGNIVSAFRDTFEGVWQNMARTLNNYQTDLKASSVSQAYKEVVLGALTSISTINKTDLLCRKYRLSNMDVYKIADSVNQAKSGIFNVENWMYATLRAPDFLNRMVLFVARCIQDGCWDAYSVENGQLKYDPRKDKRFKAYFESDSSTKEYKDAKERYYNAIRQHNKENPNNQLGYNDILSEAYSNQEIENLRVLSNSIYGAYDQSMKAAYEQQALGWAFGTFSTWMNGIVTNYMAKPGIYYDGDTIIEQDTDDSGNPIWIQENGQEAIETYDEEGNIHYIDVNTGEEVAKNDNWVKAMSKVPRVVQGIFYSLQKILPALKNGTFKEELWNDPMERANLMKAFTDAIIAFLFLLLFKCALDPAYKDYKKEMKNNPAIQNAFAEVLYKSTSRSYDGFMGAVNIVQYLGENTDPPVYSLPIKVTTDLAKATFGDKTWSSVVYGNFAVFHSFQDTFKASKYK